MRELTLLLALAFTVSVHAEREAKSSEPTTVQSQPDSCVAEFEAKKREVTAARDDVILIMRFMHQRIGAANVEKIYELRKAYQASWEKDDDLQVQAYKKGEKVSAEYIERTNKELDEIKMAYKVKLYGEFRRPNSWWSTLKYLGQNTWLIDSDLIKNAPAEGHLLSIITPAHSNAGLHEGLIKIEQYSRRYGNINVVYNIGDNYFDIIPSAAGIDERAAIYVSETCRQQIKHLAKAPERFYEYLPLTEMLSYKEYVQAKKLLGIPHED